jgi:hypothetical protein
MPWMLAVDPAGWGRVQAAPAVAVVLISPPLMSLPPAKQSAEVGQLIE